MSSSEEDNQQIKNLRLFEIIRSKTTQEKIIGKISDCLKDGANVHATNSKGKTILLIAQEKKYDEVISYLLQQPNIATKMCTTTMDDCKIQNDVECGQESLNMETESDTPCDNIPTDAVNTDITKIDLNVTKKNFLDQLEIPREGMSQHGNLFQLKLLMLVLWRATENNFSMFRLATELPEAEKFDDIVFQYKKSSTSNWKFRLLQAKHKECAETGSKISGISGFFGSEDDAFSIQKYFKSYLKIKQKCERLTDYSIFSNSEIEDVIIITNADFETENLRKYFRKGDLEADEIFRVGTEEENRFEKAAIYKVRDPSVNSELVKKCMPIFENTSDYYTLIETLVEGIVKEELNKKKETIIKEYYYALLNTLFEIQHEKKSLARLKLKKDIPFINDLVEEVTFVTLFDRKKIKISADFGIKKLIHNLKEPVSNCTESVQTLEELAEVVADDVKNERELDSSLILKFKKLRLSLDQEFLDVKNETFLSIFIYGSVKGNKKLSDHMKKFRRAFIKCLLTEKQKQMKKNELDGKELKIFEKLIKKIVPINEPIISNVSEFAEQMRQLIIDNQETKIIEINEKTPSSVKDNLHALSGHLIAEKFGKIRFCSSFLYSDQLPDIIKEFKEQFAELLKEDFKKIYQYKFKMEGLDFKTCEDGVLETTLPILHTNDDVLEFFQKLKFVVNYPNRMEINDLLESNIQNKFKILDGKAFNSMYIEGMHDWMATRIGTFFRPDQANQMLKDIANNLSIWTVDGITKAFFSEVSNEFHFRKSKNFTEFLNNEKKVLIIAAQNLQLTRIRIVQTFLNLQRDDSDKFRKYTRGFGHIFFSLKQIVNADFRSYVLYQIKSSTKLNLIVIECNTGQKNSELCRHFLNLLDTKDTIKIVLITPDKNLIVNLPIQFKQETFDTSNFDDLDDKSKLKCLLQEITFQGEQTTFKDILGNDKSGNVIVPDILCCMIEKKDVSIGCTSPLSKGYHEIYYIERNIHIKVYVDLKILKDDEIVVVTEDEDKFIEKCEQFPKNNIHWFKKEQIKLSSKESDVLTWQKTQGSISSILKHRLNENELNKEPVEEYDIINDKNNIVIISDLAGMGKSTLLSNVTKKMKKRFPDCWLFRIDLNDCTTVLSEELGTNKINRNDLNWTKNLLRRMLDCNPCTKLNTDQEEKLFFHSLSFTKKIILLLDGVDEISPNYTNIIIELILALRDCKLEKILITTRPNVAKTLERRLNVFAYSLQTFSKDNQIKFLTEFWREQWAEKSQIHTENIEDRLKMYAESFITKVSNVLDDERGDFTGIPLQLMMMAEVFQNSNLEQNYEGCFQFLMSDQPEPKLPEKLNLHDLYTMFIKEKYRIYSEEKKKDLRCNLGVEEDNDMLHRMYQEYHRTLAVYAFFDDDDHLKQLFDSSEYEAFIERMKNLIKNIADGKERKGIIDQVINNKPKFIHRTFMEYFLAEFVVDAIRNHNNNKTRAVFIINEIFENPEGEVIRSFMNNLFLKKRLLKCEFYGSVFDLLTQVDEAEIFYLSVYACGENHQEILRFILSSLKNYTSTKTCLYKLMDKRLLVRNLAILKIFVENDFDLCTKYDEDGFTILHHACKEDSLDALRWLLDQRCIEINTRDLKYRTPLHATMQNKIENSLEVLKMLLDQGADINVCDEDGFQPLHEAATFGRICSTKYLLECGVDINCVSYHGYKLLHCAAKSGEIDFCKWLINDHNVEVNAKIEDGKTPLHLAVEANKRDIIKLLLEHGANIDALDERGFQPLHAAAIKGRIDLAKYLLERGADINCMSHDRDTLLHCAVRAEKREFCEWLLNDRKVKVNLRNKVGETALHLAVENDDSYYYRLYQRNSEESIIEMLLKQGGKLYPLQAFEFDRLFPIIIGSHPALFAPLTMENILHIVDFYEINWDGTIDLIEYLKTAAEKLRNRS